MIQFALKKNQMNGICEREVDSVKRLFCVILGLGMLLSLTACGEKAHQETTTVPTTSEEVIGGDWHVWGVYTFDRVGDVPIAIDQINDTQGQHIGFDIYEDGQALGALLCQIRCTDGGYTWEDLEKTPAFIYEDHDGDGRVDIGVPLKNGDVLWYFQDGNGEYIYAETQLGDPDISDGEEN